MKLRFLLLLGGLLATPAFFVILPDPGTGWDLPVAAAQTANEGEAATSGSPGAAGKSDSLDSLYEELARTGDEIGARRLSRRIMQELADSGSDSINLLMERSADAIEEGEVSIALDLLDHVTTLEPGFAEGWNRRATVHYAARDLGRSLADIERVLALEPRHFGALSGLAIILEILDREREALETWYKVLAIYPANDQAQEKVIELEEELAGKAT